VLTGPAPVPLDKEAFLVFQQVHTDAFPDWNFNAQVVEEKGEHVRVVVQITATHLGTYDVAKLGLPLPPLPATAKRRQWPPDTLDFTITGDKISKLDVVVSPEGGVIGTLAWLGVKAPSAPSTNGASNGATNGASLKEFGYKWAELFTAGGDLALIDEIVASNFVSHSAPPGLPAGREGVREWVRIFHQAFPDIYSNAEDVIVENDKVVERFSAGGTNLGPFFGNPPTGKTGTTTGINIFRIANGKIVEHWGNSDDLGMMRQLSA
jgi:predicted ester cyclase